MKMLKQHWLKPTALIFALALAGCSGPGTGADSIESSAPADQDQSSAAASGDNSDEECYFHMFDGDDFDPNDDNFKLTEPGDYETLDDLPGADQSWTDEADSAKVGGSATVTVYAEENFVGESATLDPGSEHPDLDPEPSSLKMTCK